MWQHQHCETNSSWSK